MDKDIFVQNIKKYCQQRGVKPTVACRESGAGKDIIGQLERSGSVPSVAKVQLLAQYLGCTVSDLLGEEENAKAAAPEDPFVAEFVRIFAALSPADQSKAIAYLLRLQRGEG